MDTSATLVGITVQHQQPLSVKLMRQVGRLPLSPREAEVCLLMAEGLSYSLIAERLGISPHTAITNVSTRTELVKAVLFALKDVPSGQRSIFEMTR